MCAFQSRIMGEGVETETAAINVLIVDLPGWLTVGVKKAIEAQADMMIVAQLDGWRAFGDTLGSSVDVIVTGASGSEHTRANQHAVFGNQTIPVLAISAEDDRIDVYSCRTTHGYGLRGLIGLIREAVADAQRWMEASHAGNRRLDH
jgi:hypothetical protein